MLTQFETSFYGTIFEFVASALNSAKRFLVVGRLLMGERHSFGCSGVEVMSFFWVNLLALCAFLLEKYFLKETILSVSYTEATFLMTESMSMCSDLWHSMLWTSSSSRSIEAFLASLLFLLHILWDDWGTWILFTFSRSSVPSSSLKFSPMVVSLALTSGRFSASLASSQSQQEKNMSVVYCWDWRTSTTFDGTVMFLSSVSSSSKSSGMVSWCCWGTSPAMYSSAWESSFS